MRQKVPRRPEQSWQVVLPGTLLPSILREYYDIRAQESTQRHLCRNLEGLLCYAECAIHT